LAISVCCICETEKAVSLVTKEFWFAAWDLRWGQMELPTGITPTPMADPRFGVIFGHVSEQTQSGQWNFRRSDKE
jgi:hypothetical protein